MIYRGHVRNGVVVPEEDVVLPEGAEVQISLSEVPLAAGSDDEDMPTLYDRLKPVIGTATGLPDDASINVDHYLYGHPKR